MLDLNVNYLNDSIIFTFIGLAVATFAFLCQYLSFPQSLLENLSNMVDGRIPCISITRPIGSKNKVLSPDHESVYRIIGFFYDIDALTFTILIYLLYSIAVALMIAVVYFILLEAPHEGSTLPLAGFWWALGALLITGVYFGIIICLLYKLRKDSGDNNEKKYWRGKKYVTFFILIHTVFLLGSVYFILNKVDINGITLLLSLYFFLVILFAAYIYAIYAQRPVRAILDQWVANTACNEETNVACAESNEKTEHFDQWLANSK